MSGSCQGTLCLCLLQPTNSMLPKPSLHLEAESPKHLKPIILKNTPNVQGPKRNKRAIRPITQHSQKPIAPKPLQRHLTPPGLAGSALRPLAPAEGRRRLAVWGPLGVGLPANFLPGFLGTLRDFLGVVVRVKGLYAFQGPRFTAFQDLQGARSRF